MIVNLTANGWEIIYHRAHALLAAKIAGHWPKKNIPERFYETIAAISQHDDLEKEWEEDSLSEVGTPLDFTLEKKSSEEKLIKSIEAALYKGRWVALMTSKHFSFLHQSQRETSEEWNKFLDELLDQQKQWQEELAVSEEKVEECYTFMRWCDRLSLILCQQKLPANQRALEITKGPSGKLYNIKLNNDGYLQVMPWPFEEKKFTVDVEVHYLSQVTFSDNQALNTALKQAPTKFKEWTFIKDS